MRHTSLGIALSAMLGTAVVVAGSGNALAQGGALDPAFGTNGVTSSTIPATAAPQVFATSTGAPAVAAGGSVSQWDLDGHTLTPSTGISGITTQVGAAIDGSDRVVVVGDDANGALTVARFATGALDPAFGTNGVVTFPGLTADHGVVATFPDGSVLVSADGLLVKLTPAGALDPTWNPTGSTPGMEANSDGIVSFAFPGAGTVLATCTSDAACLERFNADGSLDSTFGTDGKASGPAGATYAAAAIATDGTIYAAGGDAASGHAIVAKYAANGTLDPMFGNTGTAIDPASFTNDGAVFDRVLLAPEGIYLAQETATHGANIVRETYAGTRDTTFANAGSLHVPASTSRLVGFGLVPTGRMLVAVGGVAVYRFLLTNDSPVPPGTDDRTDCGALAAATNPASAILSVSLPPAARFTIGSINPSTFKNPPVADPTWRINYQGFMYLPPLADRAAKDGDLVVLTTMASQLVAFHTSDPDPGTNQYGWDEGTAERRLQTENCVYALTHDPRLVDGMVADVNVQLGSRYYGPPYHLVHNHGLMANLQMIRAGELLNHPDWITLAMDRMRRESVLAFSPKGTAWEQASQYQVFDAALWASAQHILAKNPTYASAAAALLVMTTRARQVGAWLTEPDGQIVQIGDSSRTAGVVGMRLGHVFRDDLAGYVVGRFSWTSPTTTYYTMRYGPRFRAHGELDRGSLTWTTAGARVLVGPGVYTYASSAFSKWQMSPASHNVAIPATGVYRDNARASVIGEKLSKYVDLWTLSDLLYGKTHVRHVAVDALHKSLTVTDAYTGTSFLRQYWHLDPSWSLVGKPAAHRLVFANGRLRLTITTTGLLSGIQRGVASPVAGWNFPSFGHRSPAYQIVLRSLGTTITTHFVVTSS